MFHRSNQVHLRPNATSLGKRITTEYKPPNSTGHEDLHVSSYITCGHFSWPITRILQQQNVLHSQLCVYDPSQEHFPFLSFPPPPPPPTNSTAVGNPAASCPSEASSTLKKGRIYPPNQIQARNTVPTNSKHSVTSSAFIPYPPIHNTQRVQPRTKERTNVLWTPK